MERFLAQKCSLLNIMAHLQMDLFWHDVNDKFKMHKWSKEELQLKRHVSKRMMSISANDALGILNQFDLHS